MRWCFLRPAVHMERRRRRSPSRTMALLRPCPPVLQRGPLLGARWARLPSNRRSGPWLHQHGRRCPLITQTHGLFSQSSLCKSEERAHRLKIKLLCFAVMWRLLWDLCKSASHCCTYCPDPGPRGCLPLVCSFIFDTAVSVRGF